MDKLERYRQANAAVDGPNRLWPLYAAGLENLGVNGEPLAVEMPSYGPDELLVRHDAVGLCFSDIKVINLGQEHPRIFRDIQKEPVVLGHEVILTVIGVGEQLRGQYHPGDRYIVQAEIYKNGVNYAYGYMIQGGLSQYAVLDQRVLNGDHGCYLIPVQPETGYAEAALAEPWACVTAAYGLKYRTEIKPGGTLWILGTPAAQNQNYTIGAGFDLECHPARLLLTAVPEGFRTWLEAQAAALGIDVIEVADPSSPPVKEADDIVVLGNDADLIEMVSPHLANFGVFAIIADTPLPRKVNVDIGRVHYNRWVYVGSAGPDIATAYADVPVRSALAPGGVAWFIGAGGPMGRMHVQRAVQMPDGPATIVCTDVSDARLADLAESFGGEAAAQGINFVCLNPSQPQAQARLAEYQRAGFDDIVVLAPVPALIADAATHLGRLGVMNVFAGVARGTTAALDLSEVYLRDVRVIGHSASAIDDLRTMLDLTEAGTLSPNRSVAAIGSLSAARDGYQAVKDTRFPGKVVIFPNIDEMPLTALPDLKTILPTVYARLKNGREWTRAAEEEFLRLMLPK
ncbi:MAG TPA: alcohol dehydrogenase catalytic domain-containing protein [Anaerolineae bacterium]